MPKDWKILITVFLVLFVNGLGLGLLFPVLDTLLLDVARGFLSSVASESVLIKLYGFTVGIFMFSWFIGAFVISAWSDRVGRKKALIFCLLGSFLGLLITSMAIYTLSFSLLILGRIITGFAAGSQPVSQAIAIDLSTKQNRPYYLGFVILAIMLGIIGGPIIANLLSDSNLVSWFNNRTPFYFAACLSLINVVIVIRFLTETRFKISKNKQNLSLLVRMKENFLYSKVRKYFLVLFFLVVGWSAYFSYISLYLSRLYNFNDLENSGFLLFFALGCLLGGVFLVKFFGTRYTLDKITINSSIICSITVLLTIIIVPVWFMATMAVILGMGLCLAYTVIVAIISYQTPEDYQGSIMGITGRAFS